MAQTMGHALRGTLDGIFTATSYVSLTFFSRESLSWRTFSGCEAPQVANISRESNTRHARLVTQRGGPVIACTAKSKMLGIWAYRRSDAVSSSLACAATYLVIFFLNSTQRRGRFRK
ncbi:MAG: hypothetical protein A3F75_10975 [Betaproteobacteria bacterium RIFCSPLOWO2_12_FULL_64_23]|nr:MAG: hypothetical protein A3F75_10975 [Betaproteobacteria bacterium RIFCSPLOWO2_12_FULL_64_23]